MIVVLAPIGQDDFAAGMVRSVARHLIPSNGCRDLVNLLLDDDGSLYRRGGSRYVTDEPFGERLTWVWDGELAAGPRTVVASPTSFGVLVGRDVVELGGGGLVEPTVAVVIGGLLVVGGGTVYAGSLKGAGYADGTVEVEEGSQTVLGTGTRWLEHVDAGMLLSVAGGQLYVVERVLSDTELRLDRPYFEASATGQSYSLAPLGVAPVRAPVYAVGGDRLIACSGNRVAFSRRRDDETGALRYGEFEEHDYLLLPEGADILGAQVQRDLLLVFSTQGVWAVTNLAMDLVDEMGNPQRAMERVSGDVVLWGQAGLASWQGALVVPTLDGVLLMDGVSAPQEVARSITPLIEDYVRRGCVPGRAVVFGGHYFLPVLQGPFVVDLLVCRLDRAVETRLGIVFPWSRMSGEALAAAWAQRVGGVSGPREPVLLAAGANGRLLDMTALFRPSAEASTDADGVSHQAVLETRDFRTGPNNLNHVLRLRLRYEMDPTIGLYPGQEVSPSPELFPGHGRPELVAAYSAGEMPDGTPLWGRALWGEFTWSDPTLAEWVWLDGVAGESSGRDPMRWRLTARTRLVRARLQSVSATGRLVIRGLEWGVRQSARDW